jgi:hypothetical protein
VAFYVCFAVKPTYTPMSNKTRSILKAIAVVFVLLAVLMQLRIVIIPAMVSYTFWIVVIAFGVVLITSK